MVLTRETIRATPAGPRLRFGRAEGPTRLAASWPRARRSSEAEAGANAASGCPLSGVVLCRAPESSCVGCPLPVGDVRVLAIDDLQSDRLPGSPTGIRVADDHVEVLVEHADGFSDAAVILAGIAPEGGIRDLIRRYDRIADLTDGLCPVAEPEHDGR